MKKFENLGKKLSKTEQKMILGGGTCQYEAPTEFGTTWVDGQSMQDARLNATSLGTHWCCTSCCTASWANHAGCPVQE
ncbi:MAG: hypothetical protein JST10_00770 [Bacteroidetes bacterium]|nr:hypothetical protein [Bacteroidota bacterium]MBS1631082.1 hypothetical protein [Bacteroidota bacterium]